MKSAFETQGAPMARAGAPAQDAASAGLGNTPGRNRKRRFPRRSRRGVSIWGIVLGLAVIAFFALQLVNAFQSTTTTARTQSVMTTLATMESAIRRAFASRPQFEANSAVEGVARSAVPENAIRGTGSSRQIVTPWSSRITAGAGPDVGTDTASANRFWILITDIPEAACEAIGAAYLDRADVFGLKVAPNPATMGTGNTPTAAAIDDSIDDINTNCNGGDDDDIGIVFRG